MSDILYCDFGQHPFSASDENRHRMHDEYTVTVMNPAYGNFQQGQTRKVYDICGPCWDHANNPFSKRQEITAPKEPETGDPE